MARGRAGEAIGSAELREGCQYVRWSTWGGAARTGEDDGGRAALKVTRRGSQPSDSLQGPPTSPRYPEVALTFRYTVGSAAGTQEGQGGVETTYHTTEERRVNRASGGDTAMGSSGASIYARPSTYDMADEVMGLS